MKIKFKSLVAFSAFLVAGCAAFFSVFGLSQLFAGASLAVIIMASSLEFAKIISVSFLQRYWTRISNTLKTYLSIGVLVLVCITSAGIYGFLSNAYQKTATQYEIGENELSTLSAKKALFQKNIDDNKAVLDTKTKRLDQLSSLRTSQEARLNQAASNAERNRARQDINTASNEIQKLNGEIDVLTNNAKPFIDSVSFYENKMIESKVKNSGTSEVGPLKYIATLVGQPMDKVVNWFILLLIFVFDPLAMALVIATNKLTGLEKEKETDEDEKPKSENMSFDDWKALTPSNIQTEKPIVDPHTGEIDLSRLDMTPKQDYWIGNYSEPVRPNIEQLPDEPEVTEPIVEEPVIIDPETGCINRVYDVIPNEEDYITKISTSDGVTEDANEGIPVEAIIEEPVVPEPIEDVKEVVEEPTEEVKEVEPVVPEPIEELPKPKTEPVVATGQIKLEDIKEIKAQNRGFSKEIPPPTHNTIQRIGTNKYTKNSDGDKVYFKKKR